jgi:hypothetical protein
MATRCLKQFEDLIDRKVDPQEIGGWIGLPYAAIHNLPINGHLPPTISHVQKLYFYPTKEGVQTALQKEQAKRFLDTIFVEEPYNPKHEASKYAKMREMESFIAERVGYDIRTSLERIFDYECHAFDFQLLAERMSVKAMFKEEYPTNTDHFYNFLLEERGFNEERIETMYREAIKRRGVVAALSMGLAKRVQEQIELGEIELKELVESESFHVRTPADRSLEIEDILSLQSQCQHTAEFIRNRIVELRS